MKTVSFLIGPLLKKVSRSFYLTLRILPSEMREPISLAYLLARATDTIADTKVIAKEKRLLYLNTLNQWIQEDKQESKLDMFDQDLIPHQNLDAEKTLLQKIPECISLLQRQNSFDRNQIKKVLNTICSGQKLDLERFQGPAPDISSLKSSEDLDDYTYRVAGCVGEFWTEMCMHHIDQCKFWNRDEALLRGIHFGQALQLTNILRDIPRDLLNGRCYLPENELAKLKILPQDLLNTDKFAVLSPLYLKWLYQAESYYTEAWKYTLQYPKSQWRMRLACAWPILIGIKTLQKLKLEENNPLDPGFRIKISRLDVWMILIISTLCLFSDHLFSSLYKVTHD